MHRRINAEIVARAQKDIPHILQDAATSYSKELADFQTRFTSILRAIPGQDSTARIVFIDHNAFASALALGQPPATAAAQVLKGQNFTLSDSLLQNLGRRLTEKDYLYALKMSVPDVSPRAMVLLGPSGGDCLVVSASAGGIDIPGLSPAEQTAFINTHEGWHCLYNRYKDKKDYQSLAAALRLRDNNQSESFADLGAVGDMIRGGHDPALIGHIAQWRAEAEMGYDIVHNSVTGLHELKKRIEHMGLDSFRALPISALQEMYYDIIDHYCFSPEKSNWIITYLSADSTTRENLEQQARGSQKMSEALRLAQRRIYAVDATPEPQPSSDPAVRDYILAWSPQQALESKAFSLSGEITPQSLVRAHAALQDSLQAVLQNHPASPVYLVQAGVLRAAFENIVTRIDYVATNRVYGVEMIPAAPKPPAPKG